MKMIFKITTLVVMLLCSTAIYAETTDAETRARQAIYDNLSIGNCEGARTAYNAWSNLTGRSDANIVARINNCFAARQPQPPQQVVAPPPARPRMTAAGNSVRIDGNRVSNAEARRHFATAESRQLFDSGVRLANTNMRYINASGWGLLIVPGVMMQYGWLDIDGYGYAWSPGLGITGIVLIAAGVTTLSIGHWRVNEGRRRIHRAVDLHNSAAFRAETPIVIDFGITQSGGIGLTANF